ncbi:MAG TPA: alpha/beta hydrolase [Dissulfurispiraceae bacterium]|nr:alpha/beta hydrolase [Dissulfurispiraceae bacterium]
MLIRLSIIVSLSYAGMCSYYFIAQTGMIYQPSRESAGTPRQIGLEYEDIFLQTEDGVRLHGWFIPAPGSRATLLFCHGNAGNISNRLDSIRIFHALGLNVLIFDYRGYGKSEGAPDEEGTYRDGEAAWSYVVAMKETPPGRIIIFGRSLGSGIAAELALRHPEAGALMLESGFSSIADMARRVVPFVPAELLVRHRYDTLHKIPHIRMPKLIIHSPEDEVVPFEQGFAMYECAKEPKEFLKIAGSHNGGFLSSGATYRDGIAGFLNEHFEVGMRQ